MNLYILALAILALLVTTVKESYMDGDMDGILPPYHIHETNGYKIIEGTPEIAVPNQKYFP